MQQLISQPWKGGLNSDDDIENFPIHDYLTGDNFTYRKGENALEKINELQAFNDGLVDNCFGAFNFPDFSVLFCESSSTHFVKLAYPDGTAEDIIENVLFDLDDTIPLTYCVLVNDRVLVFGNGVDEIHKLDLNIGRLTVQYNLPTFTNHKSITISQSNGKVVFNCAGGFTAGITRVLTTGKTGGDQFSIYHNYMFGHIVNGYLSDSNTFITEIEAKGDISTIYGSTIFRVYETEIEDVISVYRGVYPTVNAGSYNEVTKSKSFYLINCPPLDPPEVEYVDDESSNINSLKNNSFQFQVKYKMTDGTESSWSPVSQMLIDDFVGNLLYQRNNRILVRAQHPVNYGAYEVDEVVFAVRRNEGDLFEFDRVKVIQPLNGTEIDYPDYIEAMYTGREGLISISDIDKSSQFDHIGIASAVDVVDESTLVLADNKIPSSNSLVSASIDLYERAAGIEPTNSYVYAYAFTPYAKDSGSIFTSGVQIGDLNDIRHTSAVNEAGDGTPTDLGASPTDNYFAASKMYRAKEASYDKSYAFFTFSSSQDVGTEYEVSVKLYTRDPVNGFINKIGDTKTETFVCSTTSTLDVMRDIKTWYNKVYTDASGAGLHNLPFGNPGDYIEAQAYVAADDTFNGGYAEDDSSFSMQFYAGYQCIHNDPGHYHWHQVDFFVVEMRMKSAASYISKTCKVGAKHPLAIRYRDTFGRILQTSVLGDFDLSEKYDITNLHTPDISIKSIAPTGSVRGDILYSKNKSFAAFTYAEVDTVTHTSGTTSSLVKLSFFATGSGDNIYNKTFGASVTYNFAEGDYLRRVFNTSGTVLDPKNNKPLRILSQESNGDLNVEYEVAENISVGDIVILYTPKAIVEAEDLLYYETGYFFEIDEDGFHSGNLQTQGAGGDEILAGYEITDSDWITVDSTNQLILYSDDVAARPYLTMDVATSITIHNGALAGSYTVTPVTFSAPSTIDGNSYPNGARGWELSTLYDSGKTATYAGGSMFVSWDTALDSEINVPTGLFGNVAIERAESFGDTYLRFRAGEYDSFIESYSMSDFYASEYWGAGRPATINEQLDIDFRGVIYYSEPYFRNTNLNGISTVYSSNFEEYTSNNGAINGFGQLGDMLVLFKEREISFVKINKTEFDGGQAGSIQAVSGAVLSPNETPFPYDGGIGSQTLSITRSENAIYAVDPYNKRIIAVTRNGVVPISDIKFSQRAIELIDQNNLIVYSSFDRNLDMLIMHFSGDSIDRQVIYSENDKRFKSEWTFGADRILFNGTLMAIVSGYLYAITGSDKNDINSTAFTSKLIKPFSEPSLGQKVWTNIMMDDLFVDEDANPMVITNGEGQQSSLLSSDFSRDGSGYWAEFLRDENTPNMGSLSPLLEGDELESNTLTVQLESDSTADVRIRRIVVQFNSVENVPK